MPNVQRVAWSIAVCLAVGACSSTRQAPQPRWSRQNVLLVSVDTLRADRVGGALTPVINSVAARGARFLAARTTVPLTLPAHVSLMTGAIPPTHGVRLNGVHRFDNARPTLARRFREAGYDTAAVVGAFVLDRQFGLADGFTSYDDLIPRSEDASLRLEAERPAGEVADRAIAWLKARGTTPGTTPRQSPYFLWVHFYDPHAPYEPPPAARARAGGDAYNGEVAYVDEQIGRLLAATSADGPGQRTLVVIVGDHGESLGDHGESTHGMLLYEGALRIPLVLAGDGIPLGERAQLVSIVDVAPTILRLAGLLPMPGVEGRDLFAPSSQSHEIYAETQYPQVAGWSPLVALVEDRWKHITTEATDDELYDLSRDGAEKVNVAAREPGIVRAGRARAASIKAAATASTAAAPEADAQERLRALGYVSTGSASGPSSLAPNPAAKIAAWTAFEDVSRLVAAGRNAEAVPILGRLAAGNPDGRVFPSYYARALSAVGRHQEALAAYRDAVRRWPDDSMLFHDLAVAAQRAGARDEAVRAERAAITVDPRNAAAHNGLGLVLIESGQLDQAREAFERATRLDATSVEYQVNLGNAWRETGDRSRAEGAYRRALELQPAAPDALNGLGVLLVQANRSPDAIPIFERAIQERSDFWEARLNLGIANQQAGRIDAARTSYRAVLGAPPRYSRERRAASELLASLDRRR